MSDHPLRRIAKKPENWPQKSRARMEEKGTVGSLTKIAHAAGYPSPLGYAHHVMANKEHEPAKVIKKANWAVNMNKGK